MAGTSGLKDVVPSVPKRGRTKDCGDMVVDILDDLPGCVGTSSDESRRGAELGGGSWPSAAKGGDRNHVLLAALSEMQVKHEAKIAGMLTTHMDHMNRILGTSCQSPTSAEAVHSERRVSFSPWLQRHSDMQAVVPADSNTGFIGHRAHPESTRSANSGRYFSVRVFSHQRGADRRAPRIANVWDRSVSDSEQQATPSLRPSFHLDTGVETSRSTHPDDPALQRWARRLVDSPKFELAVAALIFANALLLGVEADLALQDSSPNPPIWSAVAEVCFAFAFTIELVVHALDEGRFYLHPLNKMVLWNVFDSCVVALSWFDIALAVSQAKFSGIRMIRILKLTRALRIVRVMRYCRELREMVQGIAASLKPLFWCLVLLLLVWFTLGICILQVEHQYILDYPSLDHSEMLKFYGGMIKTIYTLFTTITGGKDWYDAAALLGYMSPVMPVIFSVYIAFAVLCVLNIVTGVFVEHSKSITAADTENMVLEEVNSREKRTANMKKVFKMALQTCNPDRAPEDLGSGDHGQNGDDHSKCLKEEQFIAFCEDVSCQAYFRSIGLLVEGASAINLFRFIDYDNDGFITQDEFVSQCNVLQGPARQLDVALLQYELKQVLQVSQKILAGVSVGRKSNPSTTDPQLLPEAAP